MSTLNVSNITDGTTTVGTSYVVNGSAKAWVNFNGTGTIAARDSLNLSSLTDNGTGNYTVNFSNAFGAADYASNVSTYADTTGGVRIVPSIGSAGNKENAQTTTSVNVHMHTGNAFTNGNPLDMSAVYITSHGDLA